jgi:DUF1365 family protein
MSVALYDGFVVHRRTRPVRHSLRYRLPWFLVDVGQACAAALFSYDRFNLFSFHEADHGVPGGGALLSQLRAAVAEAGATVPVESAQALCMPRVLGLVFNPLTVFFCKGADGALLALIYEVNNTFGQRHSYVMLAEPGGGMAAQGCAKRFHVSPFMDMALHYRFRVRIPAAEAMVAVSAADGEGQMFSAVFAGRRRAITWFGLLLLGLRFPLLAVQVLGAIHWEALKLWLKGMKVRPLPPPPETRLTFAPKPGGRTGGAA